MIIYNYFCSVCHAQADTDYANSRFEYLLPDGRCANAPTEVGWCHDCDGLRAIETLEREYWVREIRQVGEQLASITIRHRLLRNSLVHYTADFGDEKYVLPLEPEVLNGWQERLDRALVGFDVLALRQSPAHCIACGGTNFSRSGYLHLGCGGEFKGEYAGHIMLRGGPRAVQLTVEGKIL